jgi:starch-binding outer membrane protein, SusD/RagB family
MKRWRLPAFILAGITGWLAISCSESFLEKNPQGVLYEDLLATREGVYKLLIGAYSMLDGFDGSNAFGSPWFSAGSNWIYGSVTSDDAYRGSDAGDCCGWNGIELYDYESVNYNPGSPFYTKWATLYEAISRCNSVLKVLKHKGRLSPDEAESFAAEARFLRGHYYFEAVRMWNRVPWVDENTVDFNLGNEEDIWVRIEEDFSFAAEHLPEAQDAVGRATRWAAMAYLAKTYLYRQKYLEARPLLEQILNEGPFQLCDCYHDNYRAATDNNLESIFEFQHSVNDGSPEGINGNYGDILNYPYGSGPVGCCGFHAPSQNLVNAFKTDDYGLPLLDTFNEADVKNDEGVESHEPFEPYTGRLDPRLDWTVGRRGIPYLDWGPHPGKAWIRHQEYSGPYSPIKNVYYKAEEGIHSATGTWTTAPNAINYRLIRLAHVMLWRAEVAVEENDLSTALNLVNALRLRARDGCWARNDDGIPAANYAVEPYSSFTDQEYARKAVRFETRLEFAMEGHRYFDLVRWGIAGKVLNDYLEREQIKRYYLRGAVFTEGTNELFPIPEDAIEESRRDGLPVIRQNPGYPD